MNDVDIPFNGWITTMATKKTKTVAKTKSTSHRIRFHFRSPFFIQCDFHSFLEFWQMNKKSIHSTNDLVSSDPSSPLVVHRFVPDGWSIHHNIARQKTDKWTKCINSFSSMNIQLLNDFINQMIVFIKMEKNKQKRRKLMKWISVCFANSKSFKWNKIKRKTNIPLDNWISLLLWCFKFVLNLSVQFELSEKWQNK